jgi:plasmid replication initiation protein
LISGIARLDLRIVLVKAKPYLSTAFSTVVRTTIRSGAHWRRQQFSWINEWEELATAKGRIEGMEFVLPDWFYQGVIDRRLVLTIDPGYFSLTGGIERWLYRVARKHAGRQVDGWSFELRHLHAKSASLARFSDFALDIRRIIQRQPLPGYRLELQFDAKGRRHLGILPVDKFGVNAGDIGTSGATPHGTSGAIATGHQAQALPCAAQKPATRAALNLHNTESNSFFVGGGRRCEQLDLDLDSDLGGAP